MTYRIFFLSFFLFMTVSLRVSGDGMRLVNFEEEIDVKILELNENFIKARIYDKDVVSVTIRSEQDNQYPDAVIIDVKGKRHKVVCKIVEVSKRTGGVTVMVQRNDVSSIQIVFDRDHDVRDNQMPIVDTDEENQQKSPIDPDRLREQIKEELISELEKKEVREDVAIEEMKEELRIEFEEREQKKEKLIEESSFGDVKGRMLFKGRPLSGCQVKIMMLEKWGILGGVKEGIEFETITGEDGRYHFAKIPPGGYKLYWKPPGEISWIRKMKMEPDFYVEVGETSYTPDRETNVRTAN
ncbi:MAG: carboxypeptidase-like regulatory domain-containing protein [Candidatus Scalindua sp.]|nr:carboxypeptidase-like regulatory domain-containing protein [Candidatus Scalindua sp.]